MTQSELKILLDDLRRLPDETEWLEFKVSRYLHEEIGEYISALSNAACLHRQKHGYLIYGIENNTHNVIGTKFKPRKMKVGNEELENWLSRLLPPRVDFVIHEFDYDNKPVVLIKWVILEALNNCIAHQDYTLCSRIIVAERPDELVFTNAGGFFEGTVDDYTIGGRTPQKYRNSFLSHAMFNLGMIDTMGYGIHKMFQKQRERYFPLPEYDLSDPQKVSLKIYGHIIDEKYTRLLMDRTDLDLKTVILLDKVQKRHKIIKDAASYLKKNRLIEGRYPNVYIAAQIAAITGDKSSYIKNRPFDNKQYKSMMLDFIRQFGSASRKDIDSLLMNKLPDVLDEKQKRNKINNLLSELARKDKAIRNIGSDRNSSWVLA